MLVKWFDKYRVSEESENESDGNEERLLDTGA
jgi:hypothetical protein